MKFYRILINKKNTSYAIKQEDGYQLISGTPFGPWQPTNEWKKVSEVTLLPPVLPTKIIAIGLNYRSHAEEMNMPLPKEPLMFLKPLSALAAPHQSIILPPASQQVEYEGELVMVIGRLCKSVSRDEAESVIAGYTLANDVTARDLQKKDGQWTRAKGFDGFCPLGPSLATDLDWRNLTFQTYLNQELRQTGHPEDMIFDCPTIVSHVSSVMTLLPGDVILTGTPPGIGPMQSGDKIVITSEQIGILENQIE